MSGFKGDLGVLGVLGSSGVLGALLGEFKGDLTDFVGEWAGDLDGVFLNDTDGDVGDLGVLTLLTNPFLGDLLGDWTDLEGVLLGDFEADLGDFAALEGDLLDFPGDFVGVFASFAAAFLAAAMSTFKVGLGDLAFFFNDAADVLLLSLAFLLGGVQAALGSTLRVLLRPGPGKFIFTTNFCDKDIIGVFSFFFGLSAGFLGVLLAGDFFFLMGLGVAGLDKPLTEKSKSMAFNAVTSLLSKYFARSVRDLNFFPLGLQRQIGSSHEIIKYKPWLRIQKSSHCQSQTLP